MNMFFMQLTSCSHHQPSLYLYCCSVLDSHKNHAYSKCVIAHLIVIRSRHSNGMVSPKVELLHSLAHNVAPLFTFSLWCFIFKVMIV